MIWAPLLLLSVVGGYGFASIWQVACYPSARESGHRLYFRAVFYAAFLIAIAGLLHILLYTNSVTYQSILTLADGVPNIRTAPPGMWSPTSLSAVLVSTVVLGPVLGILLNFTQWPLFERIQIGRNHYAPFYRWNQFILRQAIKDNDFEKLVERSVNTQLPILITQQGGKVFVGWAVHAPNPVAERRAIRILPLLSGYRSETNQKVYFTTDYYHLIKRIDDKEEETRFSHISLSDLHVIIPTDQLLSAHLFDLEVYQYFLEQESENSGAPETPSES